MSSQSDREPSIRVSEGEQKPERRSGARVSSDRGVQWWREGEGILRPGQLRNISAGGCFVETKDPAPKGTIVTVLTLGEATIKALGEVRFSDSGIGMGIRFANIEPMS